MDEDSTVHVIAVYCCCQTCLAPNVIIIIAVISIAPYLTDKGKHGTAHYKINKYIYTLQPQTY